MKFVQPKPLRLTSSRRDFNSTFVLAFVFAILSALVVGSFAWAIAIGWELPGCWPLTDPNAFAACKAALREATLLPSLGIGVLGGLVALVAFLALDTRRE